MMQPLPHDQWKTLSTLIATLPLNTNMAQAVLRSTMTGLVYGTAATPSSLCYVRHGYGMSFLFAGAPHGTSLDIADFLLDPAHRPAGPEFLQAWPVSLNKQFRLRCGIPGLIEHERFNFRFDRIAFESANRSVPQSAIKALDAASAWNFAGSVTPSRFWRTAEDFMAAGGGWAVWEDGQPVAIAFTSFRDEQVLEIGVETVAARRGQGLARKACVGLIRQCLATGLEPVWSCRGGNTGSVRLAESLGFRRTLTLPYWQLPARDQ